MNRIKKIQNELNEVKKIADVTESLRFLANSNQAKYNVMLANFRKIYDHIRAHDIYAKKHVQDEAIDDVVHNVDDIEHQRCVDNTDNNDNLFSKIKNLYSKYIKRDYHKKHANPQTAHVIIGCDQKFCKSFIKNLISYTHNIHNYPNVYAFGKQISQILKKKNDLVIPMNMPQFFEDAEYIACKLYNYQIHVHSYVNRQFSHNIIEPLYTITDLEDESMQQKIFDDIFRIASDLYMYFLESYLFENIERSAAMFEAYENSKTKMNKLLNTYNKVRQSEITKQILAQD